MSSVQAQEAVSILGALGSVAFIVVGALLLSPAACAKKNNEWRFATQYNGLHTSHMTHGVCLLIAFIFFFWVPVSIYPVNNSLDSSNFGNFVRNQFECITLFTLWIPTWNYLWRQLFFGKKITDPDQNWIQFSSYSLGTDLIGGKAIGLWVYLFLAIVGSLIAFVLSYIDTTSQLASMEPYWFPGWLLILYVLQMFVVTGVYAMNIKQQNSLKETESEKGGNLSDQQRSALNLIGHRLLHLLGYIYFQHNLSVQEDIASRPFDYEPSSQLNFSAGGDRFSVSKASSSSTSTASTGSEFSEAREASSSAFDRVVQQKPGLLNPYSPEKVNQYLSSTQEAFVVDDPAEKSILPVVFEKLFQAQIQAGSRSLEDVIGPSKKSEDLVLSSFFLQHVQGQGQSSELAAKEVNLARSLGLHAASSPKRKKPTYADRTGIDAFKQADLAESNDIWTKDQHELMTNNMTICVVLFVFGIAYLLLLVLNIRNSSDVWTRWRYVFLFIPAAYMAYFNFDYITRTEITTLAKAKPQMRFYPMQSPFEQSINDAVLKQLRLQNLIDLLGSPLRTVYPPATSSTTNLHTASTLVAPLPLLRSTGSNALPSASTNSISTPLLLHLPAEQHACVHSAEGSLGNTDEFNET